MVLVHLIEHGTEQGGYESRVSGTLSRLTLLPTPCLCYVAARPVRPDGPNRRRSCGFDSYLNGNAP